MDDIVKLLTSEIFTAIANVVGIVGGIFAFLAWLYLQLDRIRRDKKITIILHESGDNKIELPVTIRRAELTRSEIMGRIGMLRGGKRFEIAYLNNPEFYRRLDEIIMGKGDTTLTIVCNSEELEQFRAKVLDEPAQGK